MCKFQLFSNSPPVPLFGWVDYTCGKGKRARDTVFISTVVLLRLINAEFHKKKLGVLAPGAAPDVYLKEKPRGGFLSASSHWFSRVGVNQTLPLLTLKLPQPFSLCPILLIQRLPVLQFGICLLITIENGQIFFVFCNGHWTASTLCIAYLCSTVILFDKLSTCQQFPLAESQSWGF